MHKSIVAVATLAVVALLAAACGSASGGAAASGSGVATPAPTGAGVGDTLSIAGGSSKLEVTLHGTRRLPAETADGAVVRPALFGVKLTIRNLAGSFYDDAVSLCAVLTDARGKTHNVAWRITSRRDDDFRDVLEGVRIPTGGSRTGWVYFALDPDVQPSTLRFTAEAGFGPETGVWTLE